MGRWVGVALARQIPAGTGRTVVAGSRRLALFNTGRTGRTGRTGGEGESFHAIDDACPHRGASLGDGLLVGGKVICPWHQWTFDVRSGACVQASDIVVESYPCRLSADVVEVEVPEE